MPQLIRLPRIAVLAFVLLCGAAAAADNTNRIAPASNSYGQALGGHGFFIIGAHHTLLDTGVEKLTTLTPSLREKRCPVPYSS